MMIELAPDVAASMGVNPRNYPLAVFLGTFGLWSTDIWMAVQEIKQAAADKAKAKATEAGK